MTISTIIAVCVLLILAYIFDISSAKTKIPTVILLLLVGWAVRQGTDFFEIGVPDLTPILPILGTIGLILIVLEGSLELEMNKSKLPTIGKTAIFVLIPLLIFSFGLAFAMQHYAYIPLKIGLANAIPFAIISSAIAIPSAQNFPSKNKEFITYESSLSDIFGVIFFNFIAFNDHIGIDTITSFGIQVLVTLVVSFIATLVLAYLLSKIKHHVKFIPIVLMIVLIYAISEIYHLPALVFIMLFGLFMGNLDELKNYSFIKKLQPDILNKEAMKFKELTGEIAFLVRTLFFLLFGYLIETMELLNKETIEWAIAISIGIYSLRFIFLKIFKINILPLLFIAPRGLITILLFLSLPMSQSTYLVNKSLIIQVIILTTLVMMIGTLVTKSDKKIEPNKEDKKLTVK